MSTRSYIGIKVNRKEGKFISCHWDGTPGYNGKMLLEYYSDPKKLEELLELGDISSLGSEINPDPEKEHTFDHPQKGVVVAYTRERGDEYFPAFTCKLNDYDQFNEVDFSYVYDPKNGKWYFRSWYSNARWSDLEKYLAKRVANED